MTKYEIAKLLAEELGLNKVQALEAVQKVFDCVASSLSTGDRVEIRNFGTFIPRVHRSRPGLNPRRPTQRIIIPARVAIKFKPGKELKANLTKLAPQLITQTA